MIFAPVLTLVALTALLAVAAWSFGWYAREMQAAAQITGGVAAILATFLLYRQIGQRQAATRALQNVTAGLEFRGSDGAEAVVQAQEWLRRVGLGGFGGRYPHQLSGGMRKRVALAQALILDPEIILMDEPFAALDIQTRHLMENELLELWSTNRKSVVFITHDLEEAISLSDRVVVMSAGPESHPIGEFAIDLPRPRDVAEIRLTPRFIELHGLIWSAMKEEVLKSYARQRQ